MKGFEFFLGFLSVWTLFEGTLLCAFPGLSRRLTRHLFPKWAAVLEEVDLPELRKYGAIEFTFGLLLGGYLLIMG
ncbi:MAG: hypothetical protein ACO3N7_03220 [Kiritimatiellia bacterium]